MKFVDDDDDDDDNCVSKYIMIVWFETGLLGLSLV